MESNVDAVFGHDRDAPALMPAVAEPQGCGDYGGGVGLSIVVLKIADRGFSMPASNAGTKESGAVSGPAPVSSDTLRLAAVAEEPQQEDEEVDEVEIERRARP